MPSVANGPFLLWTADRNKVALNRPTDHSHPQQDPSDKAARWILFATKTGVTATATPEEEEVRHRIERILGQLEWLYGANDPETESTFREQYAEVFALGQQALETRTGSAATANDRLAALEGDLIAEEWVRVLEARRQRIAHAGTPAKGPFLLWTTDENGRALNMPDDDSHPRQDCHDIHARQILYTVNPGKTPSTDERKVCDRVDRILHALAQLYPAGGSAKQARFRQHYVNLFGIAKLALETKAFDSAAAMQELDIIEQDLVNDKAPAVKTAKIKKQFKTAALFLIPLVLQYVILRQVSADGEVDRFLQRFGANSLFAANIVLVVIGALVGACLSYAYRKPDYRTADDLVAADSDQVSPWLRLVLIGTLSSLLVLFAKAGLIELRIGAVALGNLLAAGGPQIPVFVVGALCGIGEQFLPNTVMSTRSFLGPAKGSDSGKKP